MMRTGMFLVLMTAALNAAAMTVQLQASRDATLYEDPDGRFANGAGQYLFIGRTWDENGLDELRRRSLLHFDLGALPSGATIVSARLELTIDRVPPGATGAIARLYRVKRSWGEAGSNAPGPEGQGVRAQDGDATWTRAHHPDESWQAPGGDFDPEPVASQAISSSPQTVVFPSDAELVALAQNWLDAPADNHGLALLGDEDFGRNARRLLSREHSGPGQPMLELEYTLPPPAAVPAGSWWTNGILILTLLGAALAARSGR